MGRDVVAAPDGRRDAETAIRVLVIDARWWWREALLRVLERSGGRFEAIGVDTVDGARRHVHGVDVVIVDLNDHGAAEILALASEREIAAVALSESATQQQIGAALSAGASYAVKGELDEDRLRHLVTMAASRDALLVHASSRFLRNLDVVSPRARYNLTPREAEVLEHLAHGATNGEIAAALHLAPSSVKKLVSRVLSRLGARNRVDAALIARREGLVNR